jgi:hypothetical protein
MIAAGFTRRAEHAQLQTGPHHRGPVSFQNRDDDLTAGAGGHQKSAKVIESHQYRAMHRSEPARGHKKS